MSNPPTGSPVKHTRTWTDEHEQLTRELSSWIPQPDVRDLILTTVRERFESEKKSVGDLKRWLKRAIQNSFFKERLTGHAWSDEHQQFTEWCTAWITDDGISNEVIRTLRPKFQKLKRPPKDPSYWMRRTTAADFRTICRRLGIPPANQWKDETWELARQLTTKQNIPEDMRDSVISQVWKRFVAEVEPIENLNHWMNKVISTAYIDEIRDETGSRGGVRWQLLTQTKGAKGDVEKELAAAQEKEKGKEERAAELLGQLEDKLFLDKIRGIHASEGKDGKLSDEIIDWHFYQDYEYSDIAELLGVSEEKVKNVRNHDCKAYYQIATQKAKRGADL